MVLIFSSGALYVMIKNVQSTQYEQLRTKAELNAVTYANRMTTDLDRAINIVDSLENIIVSGNGQIGRFDTVAACMMNDNVQSIQIAPDGVVTDIYPASGNEAGKIDLIHDESRGEIVNYGIDNNMIIMQGPFKLNQGGYGIAVRNPVYLDLENGEKSFWGLTIVIIRVPELFNDSIKALNEFGYEYKLYKTDSPLTSDYKIIDESVTELEKPVSHSFELGGCKWELQVMPVGGWDHKNSEYFMAFGVIVMIRLLESLTFMLLFMEGQRRKLRKIAATDELTRLLNRNGFNEQIEHYMNEHKSEKCVGIMLNVDNFKFINDIYGHEIGDHVLAHLAKSLVHTFSENAIIGRNGGDEFCVILKDVDCGEARQKIEDFVNKTDRQLKINGKDYNYSISLGYAGYPDNADKMTGVLKYADMALYEVKLKGKHGCQCYTEDLHTSNRTQLGFKLEDISQNMPGALFIYKADRNYERILYANQEMIQLTGCSSLDEFYEFTGRRFGNLVHPDELERVENSIWSQISCEDGMVNDYVKYRLKTKTGSYKNVLDFGRIVESEHYGLVFYVLIVDYDYIIQHDIKNN